MRLYGYAAEEAIGRHASFLNPAGRKEEMETSLRQVRDGRLVERLETTHVRKDGSTIDVSVTFSPIYESTHTIVGISGISRDITQLVRARQEIAEREERIRLLLDSTAEAIYGIDLSGVCTFCNSACARLLGYDSPAALIGRQMHPLIHHSLADGSPSAPEQSPIFEAMRHREGTHVEDEVIWRADGSSFPAEYWSHPILRNGEVIGAVVTFLDVTDRRRAEKEVLDGVRRREQFLAMLSHELRNPLSAILNATRVLDNAEWTDNACHEAGQVVTRQANHMARLLDDLLDVARITRGRIVLRKESIDLRDTARLGDRGAAARRWPHAGSGCRPRSTTAWCRSSAIRRVSSRFRPTCSATPRSTRCPGRACGSSCAAPAPRRSSASPTPAAASTPTSFPASSTCSCRGTARIDRSDGGLGIGLTLLRSLVELHDGRVMRRKRRPRARQHVHGVAAARNRARPVAAAGASGRRCAPSSSSRISPTRGG